MHTVQRLADAPLTDLVPGLTQDIERRLIQIADALDEARPPDDRAAWRWSEEHVVGDPRSPRDPMPLIIGTALTVNASGADSLELALDIWQAPPPLVIVSAAAEVACWYTPDHNMHPVQQTEWLTGTAEALAVVAAAGDTIRAWMQDPREPRIWRARAGLPNAPS